jgi:alkylation response protein AidB-like acyl-CoA dehydrogenase
MDLQLSDDQHSIVDAVRTRLARVAGPARARELGPVYDAETYEALDADGFLGLADSPDADDRVAAVLLVEQAVQNAVLAPIGARMLVAPYVGLADAPAPIGLAAGNGGVVRFGAAARTVLMLEDGAVRVLSTDDIKVEPVASRSSYPLATVTALPGRGTVLDRPDAAFRLVRAWRVANAAELAGAMIGAIEVARAHVSVRQQFGRHIGSFQAVQHQLAQAHVHAQGAKWLARRAAWNLDVDRAAAVAAAYATAHALDLFDAVHQVVGAIGFTREFDLHLWSLRLPALVTELGGPDAHARAVSELSWPSTAA